MKREIKFRAWDKETKTMYFPNQYGTTINTVNGKEIKTPKQNKFLEDLQRFFGLIILSKDIELMQFTGLKDKNGKEIYEGDILYNPEIKTSNMTIFERKLIVEFENTNYKNGWSINKHDVVPMEVIGNIYENPNLLK